MNPPPTRSPARILVVDDTEANRDALARRLERRGYVVESAVDGAAALEQIAAKPFDLVLLDVMMPGLSGFEVLERLRQTFPPADLPVVMQTAVGESDDIVHAMQLGANDYVTKPLDFPVVLARVQTQLALRDQVREIRELNAKLESVNAELRTTAERTARDLALGARVQQSMLPSEPPKIDGLNFAWAFNPCEHLAGDAWNIVPLSNGLVGVYVLDVVGHGVASSLLSVAAMRALGDGSAGESMLVDNVGTPLEPAAVADALAVAFPFNADTGQYFTFFYAILDTTGGILRYVSAGHPPAMLVAGGNVVPLDQNGTPIGIGGPHADHEVRFPVGARLWLYSDGVNEAVSPDADRFGIDRLARHLRNAAALPLDDAVASLLSALDTFRQGKASQDDVTLLAIERTA